jgi:branched-subunit amino acid aminotransferase/4-amino-4-deoxychorismate lyase
MASATLIETVRVRKGVAPLWELHLRRLTASCRALGVPIPVDLPRPEGGNDRVHRVLVSRRGPMAGERPVGSTAPVRLVVSKVIYKPYPHKLVDRERFDRTLAAAKEAGADDGIMLTTLGIVAETAIWGLFWWEEGKLCAPAFELGVLPGVARARITELAGAPEERQVTLDEIRGRSLFVANAARGIVRVASLEGVEVPLDPATEALAERFWP